MRKKTDRRRRTLFISDVIWERMVKLAELRDTTVSELIRIGCIEFLERMEK